MSKPAAWPTELVAAVLRAIEPEPKETIASFVRDHLVRRLVCKRVDELYAGADDERKDGIWSTLLSHYGLGISNDNGKQHGLAAVKAIVKHAATCKLAFCQPSASASRSIPIDGQQNVAATRPLRSTS